MTTELRFLAASVILGLVHLVLASHLISFQYGYRWTASSREQEVPPLRGLADCVDQATTNFLETFPFFAALVLAAHLIDRNGALTLVRSASLFLGMGRLPGGGCGGLWFDPFDDPLERGAERHRSLPHRAVPLGDLPNLSGALRAARGAPVSREAGFGLLTETNFRHGIGPTQTAATSSRFRSQKATQKASLNPAGRAARRTASATTDNPPPARRRWRW